MITLELTPEEAGGLAELIDLAVRSGGMNAARVALPIYDNLMVAASKQKQNQETKQLNEPNTEL